MSIIVVEIDTRKAENQEKTAFDQALIVQTEHAKQFWKTLILHPHMESRLYSKEITQVLRSNTLKEKTFDNSKQPAIHVDRKTQEFYDKVKIINQVDEVKKIQSQLSKIEQIRSMQKRRHERFSKLDSIAKLKQNKSETNLKGLIEDSEAKRDVATARNEAKYDIDEYEFMSDSDVADKNIVRNLGREDNYYDIDEDDNNDDIDDEYYVTDAYNNDSYTKFVVDSNNKEN